MSLEKALGLVVRLQDFSETSQIATFLTDRFGKVSVIAKGSKRPKSMTGGALDMLTLNEIVFSTSASGGLATLREAHPLEQFQGIRRSTARYYAGLYIAELAQLFGEGTEGARGMYELAVSALGALAEAGEQPDNITAYFEAGVLRESGLAPNLETCARCGGKVEGREGVRLSVADGGLLCGACRGGGELGRGSLAALKRLFEGKLRSVRRLRLRPEEWREVKGILASFIVYNARRIPRMLPRVWKGAEEAVARWAGGGAGAT